MLLSATRISTYQICPRQYRYRYVDGLPAVMTHQMAFGRVIHETLAHLHRQCVSSSRPVDIGRGLEEFGRRWAELLEKEASLLENEPEAAQEYPVLAEFILRGYAEQFAARPLPLAVEFPFRVRCGDDTLVGFVDRIDEAHDGLEIVEFKTSKRKPSPREVAGDLQLLLYTYGVGEALGLPVRRTVYHHLRSGLSLSAERDRDDCARQVDELLSRVAPAIKEGRHPPKSGWWCRFCDYRQLCENEEPEGALLPPAPVCITTAGKGVNPWP